MDVPEKININESFKTPDDVKKLPAIKNEVLRRKTIADEQVRLKREDLLALTEKGMQGLGSAQQITNVIKDEMMNIARLGAEAEALITKFPRIHEVASVHKNFLAVEKTRKDFETFQDRLGLINEMIDDDEQNLEEQKNLLKIHYELSELREIRETTLDQMHRSPDRSYDATLIAVFKGLDDTINDFNYNLGCIMSNMVDLAQQDKDGVIVRMAIIIQHEEKRDDRIRELVTARDEYSGLASRFTSLEGAVGEVRGYKNSLMHSIKARASAQMTFTDERFMEDPEKLDKSLKWYYDDVVTAKKGLSRLMPKEWQIFDTYVKIYHQVLHDWMCNKIADGNITPSHMLAIIHFKDKYYEKMLSRMRASLSTLEPELPGGRDGDLVREYRQLIIDKVDQWMERIFTSDRKAFINRKVDDLDGYHNGGHFRTKTSGDLWIMLREQMNVAAECQLPEIIEGVTDAMIRALKARQEAWSNLIAESVEVVARPDARRESLENVEVLYDWLLAVANDSLDVIQEDSTEAFGRLSVFRLQYETFVSTEYTSASESKLESVRDTFADLMIQCITGFVKIIFATDLSKAMTEIFTPVWIQQRQHMPAICEALSSYLQDYLDRTPELLGSLLVQEMAKQLLVSYLRSVRNKNVKFRRHDAFEDRIREDIEEAFALFRPYPNSFQDIREQWRAVSVMDQLLQCDKSAIAAEYESILETYWDVKISWVEAVLRTRDDLDFGPLAGDGKALIKNLRSISADKRDVGLAPTIFGWID